jgi:hypothetical protein
MSASETAEAFLIVVKRLAKWALWALVVVSVLFGLVLAGVWLKDRWDNQPYALTKYANVTLGDGREQVRYALGAPEEFVAAREPGDTDENRDAKIITSADDPLDLKVMESPGWIYEKTRHRITVAFDPKTHKVTWVGCYSQSVYECPSVFGLNDGDDEDEVLEHLGKPDGERLDGTVKIIRYDKYNLTLYLTKKKVYMLRISEPPTP